MLKDASGRVRRMWGGYSPKLFDGHLIESQKRWWEKRCKGAVVVADGHFSWGRDNLHQVTSHTPYPELKRNKKGQIHSKKAIPLTKKQDKYNAAISTLRAQVENTFGVL